MKKVFSVIGKVFSWVLAIITPIMKTIGLLLVILGALACFTLFGAVIGIPMILVGGLLLFS